MSGVTAVAVGCRALADLLFVLHDYDAALSHYRLVLTDYKRDKALRHAAAASEMAAVCLFLQGADPKKQDDLFDAAYSNYLKYNLQRYAVRTTLLHADVLRARGRASEAAEKLLRVTISDPNDLRSALLYEQAALSFLLVKNGGAHVRKYALHLVHAGHRFLKAGLKAHGLRCYMSALRVYQDKRWTHVDDHLYSALAKHSISTQARSCTLRPTPCALYAIPYTCCDR
jgi:tetratricopeptide (TPR) repeat protein